MICCLSEIQFNWPICIFISYIGQPYSSRREGPAGLTGSGEKREEVDGERRRTRRLPEAGGFLKTKRNMELQWNIKYFTTLTFHS